MKYHFCCKFKLLLCSSLLLFCGLLSAQVNVSGTVNSADGVPVIGATVSVNGSSVGTITGVDGSYSLNVADGSTLVYKYIGYGTKRMTVNADNSIMNVVLSEDALSLDEVIVTGTFTGRTQKNAPLSLTVLDADQLQRLTSNSQADILRTVPGITAEGGGGEVATNLFVRGFPSGGQYAFTPLQIDGIPILSTFGLNSSAHDVYFRNDIGLRSLEFVRGGASTLFGAGSVAGIVNYNSIRGSDTPENKVQLEWAEGGRIKADFLTAGPLSENLFYAFSGFYRYDEGPLETGLPTRGYQLRGNIKKLFNNGNSSFVVSAQRINDNVQFYLPFPLDNSDPDNVVRPIGNDGEEIFTMLSGQLKDFAFDTPNGRFKSPIGDGVTTDGGFLMAELKHSFGNDWVISAKTKSASYEHWFNLFLDGDGVHNTPEAQAGYLSDRGLASGTFVYADTGAELGANDLLFENRILDRQRDMEELVGELNITKTVDNHNFTVGTFLSNTKALDNNWIHNVLGDFSNSPRAVRLNGLDAMGNAVEFSTDGYVNGTGRQTANNTIESSKIAFYAADEIKGEDFDFDIGVRWERASGIISKERGVGSNTFSKGAVSDNDFAIALAGLYKLSNSTNLYANFSRGYFFPQLRSVQFATPGQTQSYETETVIQGELGAKYSSNRLSGTAAVFFNALSNNRRVDFINDPNNPANVIEEVLLLSTRTVGLEATANYNISQGLNVFGNLTLQNHQFTEVEGNEDQEGNEIARTPQFMGMAGVSYDNNGFDFNLTGNFLGDKFANNSNTVQLDGFGIIRADIGYSFSLGKENESIRLGLSIFNLLDASGVTEGSPRQGNSQVAGGEFFVGRPILPRRIFLRAGFNF